jgi:uncharacterized protein (UPF0276 family)
MLDSLDHCNRSKIGLGLRAPHIRDFQQRRPALGFIEVHAENYLDFGPAFDTLVDLRRDYPVSVHGVGLSLGSADGIDETHLNRLRDLIGRTEPILVSEHLAWTTIDGVYLNDLLPLPYTEEALAVVVSNIAQAQDCLGRQILIENPSRYIRYTFAQIPEPDFMAEIVTRTGCGLLCDINNIYVSAHNVGEDALAYLNALPPAAVQEIHLAGHARASIEDRILLIDDHGSSVSNDVWELYRTAVDRFGIVASLLERDRNLPALDDLLLETDHAARILAHAA